MASNRHLSRIIALQTLYEVAFRDLQIECEKKNKKENLDSARGIVERNASEFSSGDQNKDFAWAIIEGVLKNEIDLDGRIAPAAPEWPINQIALVDLVVLRIALFELLFLKSAPPKVIINEAVELSKAFGGTRSSKFVNGVLGTIYRSSEVYNPEDDKKTE